MLILLSLLDFYALIILLFLHFAEGGTGLYVVLAAGYLIGKGIIFLSDIFSIMDIFIGGYIILLSAGIIKFSITMIFALILLYKIAVGLFDI